MLDFNQALNQLAKIVGEPDKSVPVPYFLTTPLPNVNLCISGKEDGGFPGGRIITIAGPESSGKTALVTEAMIQAQKAGGFAFFNDHEHAFHHEVAAKRGLNLEKGWFYKKPNIAEEGFEIAYRVMDTLRSMELKVDMPTANESSEARSRRREKLRDKLRDTDLTKLMPIVGVIDSIASLIPQSQDVDWKQQNMKTKNMDLAAMLSIELKRLARDVSNAGVSMFLLNQLRTNPGVMFGDNTVEPGGAAPRYYASLMIRLRRCDKLYSEWGNNKSAVIGDVVEMYTRKNKIFRPFKKTKYVFRTIEPIGLDLPATMVLLGKEAGVLGPVSGSKLEFGGTKFNVDEFIARTRSEPDLLKDLTAFVMKNANPISDGPAAADDEEDEKPATIPVVKPGAGVGAFAT